MQEYERNLSHIRRPDATAQRRMADKVVLSDYEALFMRRALQYFAGYGDVTPEARSIAKGYVQYIDMVVRDQREKNVTLYAHTDAAKDVLLGAVETRHTAYDCVRQMLIELMAELKE